MYRKKPYIVLEILLQDVVIARAAFAPTMRYCSLQKLGMRLPADGEVASRCDLVKSDYSETTWGLRVEAGSVEQFAPKIESLQKALNLQKQGSPLPLPRFPGLFDPEKRFSFEQEENPYSVLPVIVRIERRKTTEPIVHVQWFLVRQGEGESLEYSYAATSLISWRDAVTLAKYGDLYAKVSLPEQDWLICYPPGSWYPVRIEGKSIRRGENEFAQDLVLVSEGIPKEIQVLLRRYKDMHATPLNGERYYGLYAQSWGFVLLEE